MIYIKTRLRRVCSLIALMVAGSVTSPPILARDNAPAVPQRNLPVVQLSAGMYNITAQVAQTHPQRATGLMYRTDLPPHEGMLFVFEDATVQCFWMKNTPLPLSAAFVADDGRVVNIEDMTPHSTDSHCSKEPVRFVLEMNQGWFAKRGVKPGFQLRGTPFTKPAAR